MLAEDTISVQEMCRKLISAAHARGFDRQYPAVILASEIQIRAWARDLREWAEERGRDVVFPTHIMGVPVERREGPIILGWELPSPVTLAEELRRAS